MTVAEADFEGGMPREGQSPYVFFMAQAERVEQARHGTELDDDVIGLSARSAWMHVCEPDIEIISDVAILASEGAEWPNTDYDELSWVAEQILAELNTLLEQVGVEVQY